VHDATCTFPRSQVQPVLCCDEFEGLGAPPRKAEVALNAPVLITESGLSEAPADVYARGRSGQVPAATPAAPAKRSRMSERFVLANREWYPGLCRQCDNAKDCTLPQPAGGVFACDEFA
jgi:hypothetical protein